MQVWRNRGISTRLELRKPRVIIPLLPLIYWVHWASYFSSLLHLSSTLTRDLGDVLSICIPLLVSRPHVLEIQVFWPALSVGVTLALRQKGWSWSNHHSVSSPPQNPDAKGLRTSEGGGWVMNTYTQQMSNNSIYCNASSFSSFECLSKCITLLGIYQQWPGVKAVYALSLFNKEQKQKQKQTDTVLPKEASDPRHIYQMTVGIDLE